MSENKIESELDRAWDVLEVDPEEALRITDTLPLDVAERHLVRGHARLDLGEIEKGEAELAQATDAYGEDEAHVRFLRGRVRLLQWDTAAAREAFELVTAEVFGPELLVFRAMVEELEENFEHADELYAEAGALSEDGFAPPRLTPDGFRDCVAAAADQLPPPFREAFERTAVIIDPMPTRSILDAENTGHPPDTLGVFVGTPLIEAEPPPGELPATIFLFQRNLERFALDREELIGEIQVTLYHELGHALGFDEDGVDEMGLA